MRKITLGLVGLLSILGVAGCANAHIGIEPNSVNRLDYTVIANTSQPKYAQLVGMEIYYSICTSSDQGCRYGQTFTNRPQILHNGEPASGSIKVAAAFAASHFYIKEVDMWTSTGDEVHIDFSKEQCGLSTTIPTSHLSGIAQINISQQANGEWNPQCFVQQTS